MRNLHKDAAAVARARIRAHRAAVVEIEQNFEAFFDEVVRFAIVEIGDEADATGVHAHAPAHKDLAPAANRDREKS